MSKFTKVDKKQNWWGMVILAFNTDQAFKFSRKKTITRLNVLEMFVGGLWLKTILSVLFEVVRFILR